MSFARRKLEDLDIAEVPDGFADLPQLESLRQLWQGKCHDGLLPARGDFPLGELRPWIGHVSLLDVGHDPRRFRWRLIGSHLVEVIGRDATGRWLEELYDRPTLAGFERIYSQVVDTRTAIFYRGDLRFAGKDFIRFRAVVMPLSEEGVTVNMLLLCLHFDL